MAYGLLTCRPQLVRANGVLAGKSLVTGVCLILLLYNVCKNDCKSDDSEKRFLKFADDTILVSLFQDGEVKPFPQVNCTKNRDMAINSRKTL